MSYEFFPSDSEAVKTIILKVDIRSVHFRSHVIVSSISIKSITRIGPLVSNSSWLGFLYFA